MQNQLSNPHQTAAFIKQRVPGFTPKIGLILGSGVGKFAKEIADVTSIDYEELPGMRGCNVEGHRGLLHLGQLKGVPIACFQGRNHLYEGYSADIIQTPIRTLKLLGAETVILIAAVGSMSPDMPPGSLVIINDHINFQFSNPLVGPNDNTFGPRFPSLEDAYDPELRANIKAIATSLNIPTREGVYVAVLGPSFETPAEIRAFKKLGADVVGMSTVAEVITARHCGLKVLAISIVTNMAVGMSEEKVEHQGTLETASLALNDLSRLLLAFVSAEHSTV
ncbi:MAG TPA: purine-nucleoside phosphorylase [Gammaproteobacteria bacterium]|nr:purine-nucleoside phosphorylase [Gammaproteobacteria bacterium]